MEHHRDLLARLGQNRDRAAFAELFRYFAPRVKSYLMRLAADADSAEEIMQEVMLTVWQRADTFDPRSGSASTWIYTIARNRYIDRVRRERRPEIDPSDPVLASEPEPAADHRIASGQDRQRLLAALAFLPDDLARVLRGAYFDEKSHSVLAAEFGLPLGTVKSRLRLAVERLRRTLEEL